MYTFRFFISLLVTIIFGSTALAQDSNKLFQRAKTNDSSKSNLNMDAIYNRPFLNAGKVPIAIGGYVEANTLYSNTDGVNEGFHFQMRRMTLFFSSTVAQRIKFISEMEFEEGTKEINIENAVIDVELHPLATFRSGIILNPIGAFNQNHDGPRWDFIDRPLVSTEIIPSTLSNVGFGLHGKHFYKNWIVGYEAYLTNGFNDKLILNESNRTSFAEAKEDVDKFERSFSGSPMANGKLAIRNRNYGELGFSFLSGVYNQWQADGLVIDSKRRASIAAIDFSTSILKNRVTINGEMAKAFVQLPNNYVQTYGSKQQGFYLDVVGTLKQGKMLMWNNAKLNLGLRADYVDYNTDEFRSDNQKIYEHCKALTAGIAFRPVATAVIRFNYKWQQNTDIVGNPASNTGSILFGLSSYF